MKNVLWILLALIVLGEIYTFIAVKTITRSRIILWMYTILSIFIIAYIIWSFLHYFSRSSGQNSHTLFTIGLALITFIPKILLGIVLFGEDIFRVIRGFIQLFAGEETDTFLPGRRRFLSLTAIGLAAIPFLSLLYGMTKGKYNYKVRKKTLYFPDLPENFDGFTITQISDVHSGSFAEGDREDIEHAIALVNEQNSDLVLFTGDIVNTHAREMDPWVETFQQIETPPMGKFSVLGNHDYGEYVEWPTQAEKDENFTAIKDKYRQSGFKLLLNENVKLNKDGQEIALVGVENWGHNFKKAGNLKKASEGIGKDDFKVLMSHDPSHWELEVKHSDMNYHLTLSGHTHGLQFGIEIPGVFKWSPIQYVYKQWAGLYEHMGRYVYVNRGFGYHAYPGRVGIWPEITVLELKRGQKIA